jgi:outer membrane protein assembly factor BamB
VDCIGLNPVMHMAARGLGVITLALTAFFSTSAAPPPSERLGTLVGLDGRTGHELFRAKTDGPAVLDVVFASKGVVVVERRGCFSADLPDPDGSTVLVGYDDRTGKELWHHRAGVVAIGPGSSGWLGLTPGALPVRDVATGEQFALHPATGNVLWSRGVDPDLVRASTADMLLMTGRGIGGDRLTAVDRTTGRTRWQQELDGGRRMMLFAASADLAVVVVGGPQAGSFEEAAGRPGPIVQVLSARTGELLREIPLAVSVAQQLVMRKITIEGSTIVLDAGELLAFDASTGAERWRRPGSLSAGLPAGDGRVLLTQTGAGTGSPVSISAVDPRQGRLRWVRDLGLSIYGAAATQSTTVVVGRDRLRALDPSTGRKVWARDRPRGLVPVPGMTGRALSLVGGCPVTNAD